MEKVQGFGGLLLQASVGLFLWVFGLPQALEQLPQRAVHSALAIRQMVAAAQALELGPCPAARLAAHLGAVQVERPAQALLGRILAVWDTIALPIRLLGQARPWELVVSPKGGQVEEGLRLLAEAFTVVRHNGECLNEAELYRLQGELLLAQASIRPMLEQAEVPMQQALAVARRQRAKSLELRAAMSLSRLWQQRGKRAEAHDLLAPVHGWCTEGLDTADLQEAKALLEELS